MANISGVFSYLTALSSNQGYQVLSANLPQSINNFVKESGVNTDITAFEKGVAATKSVTDFVNNPKLVDFVATAFGLDSVETSEQGLIKQVLTQDPNAPGSLVNQLSDPRFKQLATALDFYDNGLGKLKSADLTTPTTATSAEGISLTGATGSTAAASSTTALSLGLSVKGGGYLQIEKSDGTTAYATAGYFTLNKSNQLALPDGSTLFPPLTFPTNATAITTDTQGDIYAQVAGKPQLVGQLLLTNFANPSALKTDPKTGYITATTAAGKSTVGIAGDTKTGLGTISSYNTNTSQNVVNNYVTNLFEESVGDGNTAVREALYFQRNIATDTNSTGKDAKLTNAYNVLGDSVLRDVLLTTIGQPASIAEQSLSTQVNIAEVGLNGENFQNKTQVTSFVQRYLSTVDASGQSTTAATTSSSPAVQLLTAFNNSSSSTSSAAATILKLSV